MAEEVDGLSSAVVDHSGAATGDGQTPPQEVAKARPATERPARWRQPVAAAILVVLGLVCLTIAPVAIWGRNLILNTGRYVQTLAPLASDPAVQDAVTTKVSDHIDSQLDVRSFLGDVLPPKAAAALTAPLTHAISNLVSSVTSTVVRSSAFQSVWNEINRIAHKALVAILEGRSIANGVVSIRSGVVSIDLSQLVDTVKTKLVSLGIGVASNIPVTGATIEVARLKGVERAQQLVRVLNTLADWLPLIGVGLVGAGIVFARRRRRTLLRAALGLCGGMVLLGIGLAIARHIYLSSIPTTVLPPDAASSIFSIVVRYLRWSILIVLIVGVLIAAGTWVGGDSSQAVAIRRYASRVALKAHRGDSSGPVSTFVDRYRNPLRVLVLAIAGLVAVLVDAWSVGGAIALVLGTVVALALIEFLRVPARRTATA